MNSVKPIIYHMKFVKSRGNAKARVTVQMFDALKNQFLEEIKESVVIQEIPSQLIINWH